MSHWQILIMLIAWDCGKLIGKKIANYIEQKTFNYRMKKLIRNELKDMYTQLREYSNKHRN